MDNHNLPEEYETDTRDVPFLEYGDGSGGDGAGVEGLDPIIVGLLQRLPKAGTVWSKDKRKIWLGLLEGSFDLIYGDSSAPKRF